MNLDHAEVLVALLVAGAGAMWRAGSLRPDVRKEWRPRVEDARIGLSDRATQQLVAMHSEITDLLAWGGSLAIPRSATVDPGMVAARARDFQRTLKLRRRIDKDFERLLKVGPLLVGTTGLFLFGWTSTALDDTEIVRSGVLEAGGLGLMGVGSIGGVLLLLAYVVLQQRLSGAELKVDAPLGPRDEDEDRDESF